jgi:ketosteroid isomerase-like protein
MIRLLVPLVLLGCHAAHPRNVIAEATEAAAAFDAAQLRGDRAAIERYLAADFVFVRGSGKVSGRDAFVAAFTSPTQKLDPFAITNRRAIRVADNAVLIGGEAVLSGTEEGKPFSEHFVYVDLFAFRDDRWQVIYTQVTMIP